MPQDLCRLFVDNFLKYSWRSVEFIVKSLENFEVKNRKPVKLFRFIGTEKFPEEVEGQNFFLRGSVEYANPQITVEEMQGIIGVHMLEVCGNFFHENGLHQPDRAEFLQICELMRKPSKGPVRAFLLNTDEVEADRYSMNPLKTSIVQSGQSAFPAAYVKTDDLAVDDQFVAKYLGKLISKSEVDLIRQYLKDSNGSYLDMIDGVKYAQMELLSDVFGMHLVLPSLRMPISTLESETKGDLLHHLISEVHTDYDAVKEAYACMGRSMNNRTTLLTVPHSKKGYGSKRAARGKIYFDDSKLKRMVVRYKDTALYPNEIDPDDVSVAKAKDKFTITADKLIDYSFGETPSSPQFFLYSLGSPEDGALWHGVGTYAAPQLLQSYASVRGSCKRGDIVENLNENYGVKTDVPLQFNLVPEGMWMHPKHRNIDASIGTVEDLLDLTSLGMKISYMSQYQ